MMAVFDFLLLNVIKSVLTCLCEVVLNLLDPQCWMQPYITVILSIVARVLAH